MTEATYHTLFIGPSSKGKSMLNRLNDGERKEWDEWMATNPGVNGMDWPGWPGVAVRVLGLADNGHLEIAQLRGDSMHDTLEKLQGLVAQDDKANG